MATITVPAAADPITATWGASVANAINGTTSIATGIKFPATQVPSADVNTLDDYEEGTWTPTVTAGTGTFTSVSGAGVYTKIGNLVFCNVTVTITTNGTAAASVIATLPFTVASNGSGCGRADAVSGKMLQVRVPAAGSASIFNYDNTYPGATGELLRISFFYQV